MNKNSTVPASSIVPAKSINPQRLTSDSLVFKEFTSSKQAELFETLKHLQFNGQLVLTGLKARKWVFHFYRGHIMYATGGIHPVRRWKRNLEAHIPQFSFDISEQQKELAGMSAEDSKFCWQYQLLCSWVEQPKITREQATRVIWSTVVEVLFDVTQAREVTCELKQDSSLSAGLVLIDAQQAVAEVERQWLAWQAAKLTNCSPNQAPAIKQPEQLQQSISAHIYQTLSQLLDGQQTLRDLAVQRKQDVVIIIRSLLSYVQLGLVELVNLPDLPAPVVSASVPEAPEKPLIACVDDSPLICQAMEKIVSAAGYRFVGVNDPLRAIGVLLAMKPDVIFLDLMMPNTNGYELCEKLRKLSAFRTTPILILTGNDGIVDRVRAKMVGSSDFLSKAKVDTKTVLGAIRKHLRHCTLTKIVKEAA